MSRPSPVQLDGGRDFGSPAAGNYRNSMGGRIGSPSRFHQGTDTVEARMSALSVGSPSRRNNAIPSPSRMDHRALSTQSRRTTPGFKDLRNSPSHSYGSGGAGLRLNTFSTRSSTGSVLNPGAVPLFKTAPSRSLSTPGQRPRPDSFSSRVDSPTRPMSPMTKQNFKSEANEIKVVFLDIDGVICCNSSGRLEEMKLKQLARVIKETDAKVVLSTDWRRIPVLKKRVIDTLARFNIHTIGSTPMRPNWPPVRPDEIISWLTTYNDAASRNGKPSIQKFVALDDRPLLEESGGRGLEGHFVHTHMATGLSASAAAKAISILNS